MDIQTVEYPTPGPLASRPYTRITDAIVHHSAGNPNQTPLEIDAEHRARGMAMIGYNWIIAKDGMVYAGRPVQWVPAAAYGRNTESVNICVLGNFEAGDSGYTGPPNSFQIAALTSLLVLVHHQLPTIVRTIGHSDVSRLFYPTNPGDYSTACPGSELYKQLGTVRGIVAKHLTAL